MSIDVFSQIKFFFLVRSAVDSFVSRLFRRWTIVILICLSLIVTFVIWFGHSIYCRSNRYSNLNLAVITSMCYHQSLLQFVPGFDTPAGLFSRNPENKHYFFYKWVNIMLLLHAVLFYLPYLFWKRYENGFTWRLASSIGSTDDGTSRNLGLENLAKHVLNSRGKYMLYTALYVIYEIANFIISIVAIVYLTKFFDIVPVPESIPFNVTNAYDFTAYYFPNTTLCKWFEFDTSGDLMTHSTLCHLPLNEMYMHIYFFLNGWYICLAVLSGVAIACRFLLFVPPMRLILMKIRTPLAQVSHLHHVCYRFAYSDWFFLTRLQKVMPEVDFAEMTGMLLGISNTNNLQDVGKKVEETIQISPMGVN